MNKQLLLHWAEVIDSLRVFPRLVLVAYGWFVYQVVMQILHWYFNEPAAARGAEETAMVIGVTGFVSTLGGYVFRVYSDNGRNWNEANAPTVQPVTP
jgi:hypothetical protein